MYLPLFSSSKLPLNVSVVRVLVLGLYFNELAVSVYMDLDAGDEVLLFIDSAKTTGYDSSVLLPNNFNLLALSAFPVKVPVKVPVNVFDPVIVCAVFFVT